MRCMFDFWGYVRCHFYSYSPGRKLCELNFGSKDAGTQNSLPYEDWESYIPVVKDAYNQDTMEFKGQPLVFINNYKLKSGQ